MREQPERGRLASLVMGVVFVLAGIPMLVCPGPGLAAIVAGLGMIGYALVGRRAPRE